MCVCVYDWWKINLWQRINNKKRNNNEMIDEDNEIQVAYIGEKIILDKKARGRSAKK